MYELSGGQLLSLFLAARIDPLLSTVERGLSLAVLETLYERRQTPPDELQVGQWLTPLGRAHVRSLLPEPTIHHFPRMLEDVIRRVLATGQPCTGISIAPVIDGIRKGWRVLWEGEGWEAFSRQSTDPRAALNRFDLEQAAIACGLVPVPDPAPTLLVLTPTNDEMTMLDLSRAEPLSFEQSQEFEVSLDPIDQHGMMLLGRKEFSAAENLSALREYYRDVLRKPNARPILTAEEVDQMLAGDTLTGDALDVSAAD